MIKTLESKGKNMSRISIIVPVYNINEEYLQKCITSLIKQSLKDIEIILVDDGSTNGAEKLCDDYEKRDSRIKTIHQNNQGVAVARNAGLAAAQGEWIIFVDADDWCELDMCEIILERAVLLNTDILIFNNYAVKEENKISRNQFFGNDIEVFDKKLKDEAELKTMVRSHPSFSFQPPENMMGGTWCKLINHNFLKKTGILFEPELIRSQDIIFYLNLFECAEKISYLNCPLYYYRYSSDSVSKRYRKDAYKIFNIVLSKQDEFIKGNCKPNLFRDVFTKGVMVTIGTCMRTDFMHESNKEGFWETCSRVRAMIHQEPVKKTLKSKTDRTLNSYQKIQKILLKYNLVELYIIIFKINGIVLRYMKKEP
jgi:glycosyltransferase involved in cell wall biosynthesis